VNTFPISINWPTKENRRQIPYILMITGVLLYNFEEENNLTIGIFVISLKYMIFNYFLSLWVRKIIFVNCEYLGKNIILWMGNLHLWFKWLRWETCSPIKLPRWKKKVLSKVFDMLKSLTICRISIVFCFSLFFSEWYGNSNDMLMSWLSY
jgi:hypothetical protein